AGDEAEVAGLPVDGDAPPRPARAGGSGGRASDQAGAISACAQRGGTSLNARCLLAQNSFPQRISFTDGRSSCARRIARSAMCATAHSKYFGVSELTSMSGAGFMKSIAYGTPSRIAHSAEHMS